MSCTDPPLFPALQDRIQPDTLVKIGTGTPRFVVGYWSIHGLGAPLRMMLSASGVTCYWVAMYDVLEMQDGGDRDEGWNKNSWKKDKVWMTQECNPFMNLPFLIDVQEQQVLVQTNSLLSYLGRELNMMGSTKLEMAKCEELLGEIYDVHNNMVGFAYGDSSGTPEGCLGGAQASLKKLEAHLGRCSAATCLVGNKLTAPDFHLYEMLFQYDALARHYKLGDFLESYPKLAAYKTCIERLPELQSYLNSSLHKELPFNNVMARFGSDPSENAYQRGQKTPWMQQGVVLFETK